MRNYAIGEVMSDEDSIAHFGVKGMKWGVRRNQPDSSGVTRKQARQQIRTQNRESRRRLADFEAATNRSDQIRAARRNEVEKWRKYADTRRDIKTQKKTGALGKNKARVMLNDLSNKHYEDVFKAESMTTGEAFAEALFDGMFGKAPAGYSHR